MSTSLHLVWNPYFLEDAILGDLILGKSNLMSDQSGWGFFDRNFHDWRTIPIFY